MKVLLFIPVVAAFLAGRPAEKPRRTSTCRPAVTFSLDFKNWVTHTIRDTSWYAQESRNVSGLSFTPSATVALVTDPAVCGSLAAQFARAISGRDTVNANDVIVVAVDSAYYAVTDLGGGPSNMAVRNPDGSTSMSVGRSDFVDAITIDRALGTTKVWKWEQLPGRPVPY